MKKKDTFKIGELSRLFDIGVDSIRYYEKVGILHPIRNYENNYRMYTIDDVRRLALIRELLGLSFSTDQIREYDEDRNVDSTTALLRAELDVVDAEISKLKATRDSIQNRLDTITALGSPDIQNSFEDVELLPDLYKYAKDHQLQIAGDPVEMCHIDDYETNDEDEYIIELQLMVK